MDAISEITSKQDQKIASSSLSTIKKTFDVLSKQKTNVVDIKIAETGEVIQVPKKAVEFLFVILSNMSQGKSITVIPSNAEVSTQQAAEMLNVSRPFVVKLIDEGRLSSKKVGSHRRILLEDLVKFEKSFKKQRTKALEFLTQQAQDLGMGY
jgi:excisionase family DNA binding protein